MEKICPLCNSGDIELFTANLRERDYYKCNHCYLVFMDAKFHLDLSQQKLRYDLHENTILNQGYVSFLKKCINPSLPYLQKLKNQKEVRGLDYGSGPNPTLSKILSELDYQVDDYDPIYQKNLRFQKYDFIYSTEVWEHFREPAHDVQKVKNLLKPEGILSVMTYTWDETIDFTSWHYAKDETHTSFFHKKTFNKVQELFHFKLLENPLSSVWIFENQTESFT
ncbi:MAG: hypothetical protein CK427_05165 [Leptospira sp.]|nr:MAG: hypothetical protein CK427_05165 [Leptospira sp.]